jgi:hypothetical protein
MSFKLGEGSKRVLNKRIAIFDLDGCVSDDRWRRDRIPKNPTKSTDFDHYHDVLMADPPLSYGFLTLQKHIENGDFIVFMSCRPQRAADGTAGWIKRHFNIEPFKDFITLLRPDAQIDTAERIKEGMLSWVKNSLGSVLPGDVIAAAYDDSMEVVRMYVRHGIESWLLNEDGEYMVTPEEDREPDPLPAASGNVPVGTRYSDRMEAWAAQDLARHSGLAPHEWITHQVNTHGRYPLDGQIPDDFDHTQSQCDTDEKDRAEEETGRGDAIEIRQTYSHYYRPIPPGVTHVDLYRFASMFNITDQAIFHAIKKLVVPGLRTGGKSTRQDVEEAIASLRRWLEMEDENRRHTS